MTLLQSLLVKLAMLAITAGIMYWALSTDAPEQVRTAEATGGSEVVGRLAEEAPAADGPTSGIDRKGTVLIPTDGASALPARQVPSPVIEPPRRAVTFPLDLNRAAQEDLVELPGIGETLAQRIVAYRKAHAGFRSVEDLRKVKGIGKKRMDRLRPLVKTASAHD